jgi:hypothetical protein
MENVKEINAQIRALEKQLKEAKSQKVKNKEEFELILAKSFDHIVKRDRTLLSLFVSNTFGVKMDIEEVLNNKATLMTLYREFILRKIRLQSKSTDKTKWKNWRDLYTLFYYPEWYEELVDDLDNEKKEWYETFDKGRVAKINKGIKESLVPFGTEQVPEKLVDFLMGKY